MYRPVIGHAHMLVCNALRIQCGLRYPLSIMRPTNLAVSTVPLAGIILLIWIDFIPAWIIIHINNKVRGEITKVEFWEWISNVVPYFIMDVITHPCRY